MSVLERFHPAVARWFAARFPAPTTPQLAAWPAILDGRDALIAAPTGSGKTLAAFLCAIDRLVREAAAGALTDTTQVVYISPLKALSNDIQRNLEEPLAGIAAQLWAEGLPGSAIRTAVRTRHPECGALRDAAPPAAYPGHHARVSLSAADQ
jgi:ATP-dependent Lhr-like helicase